MTGDGLAIDPGHPASACAYSARGELVHVEFNSKPHGAGLDWIVVEEWQSRGAVDLKKIPNLIKMHTAGMLAAGFASGHGDVPVKLRTPGQWKGSVPKPICHRRLWDKMTPAERRVVGGDATLWIIAAAVEAGASRRWPPDKTFYPTTFKMHNILDAVALLFTELGRLPR